MTRGWRLCDVVGAGQATIAAGSILEAGGHWRRGETAAPRPVREWSEPVSQRRSAGDNAWTWKNRAARKNVRIASKETLQRVNDAKRKATQKGGGGGPS